MTIPVTAPRHGDTLGTTSPSGVVVIERTTWDDPRVVALRDAMDAEIHPRYAHLVERTRPPAVETTDVLTVLIALVDGEAAGTASLKRTGRYAEVKRVFVHQQVRRSGVASVLLSAVEEAARDAGYPEAHLQTGFLQPEAQRAYERNGWHAVAPFGPYQDDTVLSRCYAKALVPLVVAAELDSSGTGPDIAERTTGLLVELDTAGADLALLDDVYLSDDGTVGVDAPTLAAAAAPRTGRLSIAPRIRVTHTEPFHVAKVVQTLDWVSAGRAGWVVDVSTSDAEAGAFGRRVAPQPAEAWAEADDVVEVARRLWDTWVDDAEIRDGCTGRFVDKRKIHYADFEGRWFSVKGPSIVPRSPQGQIPVVVELRPGPDHRVVSDPSFATAVRHADVVWLREGGADAVADVRSAFAGRPDVIVLLDLALDDLATNAPAGSDTLAGILSGWRASTGADGVVLRGAANDLLHAVRTAARALPTPHGSTTLRARLGLDRPASRYATRSNA